MTLLVNHPHDVAVTNRGTVGETHNQLHSLIGANDAFGPHQEIEFEYFDGTILASIVQPPLYGEGSSLAEAMVDLFDSMCELQRELRAAHSLSPALREQLKILDSILAAR